MKRLNTFPYILILAAGLQGCTIPLPNFGSGANSAPSDAHGESARNQLNKPPMKGEPRNQTAPVFPVESLVGEWDVSWKFGKGTNSGSLLVSENNGQMNAALDELKSGVNRRELFDVIVKQPKVVLQPIADQLTQDVTPSRRRKGSKHKPDNTTQKLIISIEWNPKLQKFFISSVNDKNGDTGWISFKRKGGDVAGDAKFDNFKQSTIEMVLTKERAHHVGHEQDDVVMDNKLEFKVKKSEKVDIDLLNKPE